MVVGEVKIRDCYRSRREVVSETNVVEGTAKVMDRRVHAAGQTIRTKRHQERAGVRIAGPLDVDVEISSEDQRARVGRKLIENI